MPRILRRTDYRPLERPNHVRIVHHKTGEVVWHPLEAAEATRKPHNLRAAIIELDKQGTTSLFWSQRRAEKHRPDDLIGKIDENPVQPEVHRVDPSTLLPTLEEGLGKAPCGGFLGRGRRPVLGKPSQSAGMDVTCRRIGAPLLFERLWQESGCRAILEGLLAERRFEFEVERAVFLTVLHRLMVSAV